MLLSFVVLTTAMTTSSSSSSSRGKKRSFHKQIVKAVFRGLQRHSKHGDHSYRPLEDEESSASCNSSRVPKGYLAVYVGTEQQPEERFLVKTEHLHHPIFKVLLKRSEEEFRFCHKGALLIPCSVQLFQLLLCHIENDDMILDSFQAEELVRLYFLSTESQLDEDTTSP